MEVTEVRISPAKGGKIRAFASIVIDDCFIINDLRVIEGQLRKVADAKQARIPGIAGRPDLQPVEGHERVVGDGDHALPRVPVRVAERAQLFEERGVHPGLLPQLAPGSATQALPHAHEAARQCPHPCERLTSPLNQKHFQVIVVYREYDDIDGDRRVRVLIGVGHRCLEYKWS